VLLNWSQLSFNCFYYCYFCKTEEGESITPHNDYIRVGCVLDIGPSLIASGSYDHTVKIWDTRSDKLDPTHFFHLDAPVDSVICRKSFVIASAGKTVKIFDLIANKVIKTLSGMHSKTITCLCNYDSNIITGSLDGHLKVFNNLFTLVTTLSYVPSQLISLAVSSKATVVGTNDGHVIVRRFKSKTDSKLHSSLKEKKKPPRYFNFQEDSKAKDKDTLIVPKEIRETSNLALYDRKLRSFCHSKALDITIMRSKNRKFKPETVVSMMQELTRRNRLKNALAGRDYSNLKYIMQFMIDYIRDPRFSRILIDVAIILCDIYRSVINGSEPLRQMFQKLQMKVNRELELMQEMLSITGQINLIINNNGQV